MAAERDGGLRNARHPQEASKRLNVSGEEPRNGLSGTSVTRVDPGPAVRRRSTPADQGRVRSLPQIPSPRRPSRRDRCAKMGHPDWKERHSHEVRGESCGASGPSRKRQSVGAAAWARQGLRALAGSLISEPETSLR